MTSTSGRTDGRELAPGVVVLSTAVALISIGVGALLVVASVTGHAAGPWVSPEALSPGLLGAAMAGVAPALLTVGRSGSWAEVRTLIWPLAVVLVGLFAVSLLNGGALRVVSGGPIFLVLFSLGWVATLALLALGAVVCLVLQLRRPVRAPVARIAPLPGWSKPALALLGAGWFGLGTGLLVSPAFWGALVPWAVSRADAQGLGVWALALGVGVLGSLAEDDLARIRPALLSVPLVALAAAVLLAVHASAVDWGSGPALSLVGLVVGLLATGVSGQVLWTRHLAAATG
ncbi:MULTISPECIES: hypothetical protein [unclassified Streptomyces]|uniref:hypothetical protein n=1 Tax=unclassified Streptomyces TaxID=2593676 RepID=UPI002E37FF53|nr:hypothetical protein [Streptomyces sp. NBC_01268]